MPLPAGYTLDSAPASPPPGYTLDQTPDQPKSTSLDWSAVVHNLPGSLKHFIQSTAPGPSSAEVPVTKPNGRFSQSHPDVADRVPMLASAADSLEELVHNVTHLQEFFEKDPVGAAQTVGNLAAGGFKMIAPEAYAAAGEVAKGAAVGAGKGAVAPTQLPRVTIARVPIQIESKLPASIAAGGGGAVIGAHYGGLPGAMVGGAIGATAPMVAGAFRGAKAALATLAEKRAIAAQAFADAQQAAQDAATAIKTPLVAEPATTPPAAPEVIPPSRQLAAPSGPPPIIAGPITPTEIPNPPTTPQTNWPDAPAPATAPIANATPEVAAQPDQTPEQQAGMNAPPRVMSLNDIIAGQVDQGMVKHGNFAKMTAGEQNHIRRLYEHINAEPTDVTRFEDRIQPPAAPALGTNATSQQPEPVASTAPDSGGNAPSDAAPESGTVGPVSSGSVSTSEVPRQTQQERPTTPATEPAKPAKSRGLDEINEQITADLAKRRASVPAESPEDASDAAKIIFRDGSVAHLTAEQTQALHDYVTGKKPENPIPTAYRSKSNTGLQIPQEAAARDAIAQTAAEHLYKTGIKPEQIRQLTPDAQKLFWDNLSQLEGLSKQEHYSMSPDTINATMGKLVKMSKGGAVAPPAPTPPQVTVSGKPVSGMTAQQIAEALQQEMMR